MANTAESILTIAIVFPLLTAWGLKATAATSTDDVDQPIVVEFFTSEGCSSCPPSDRFAIALQKTSRNGRELIILSEHVDYWNHIGWQDRYSSPAFTARQQDYARTLGQNSVYTPEVVVDGSYGMVGSNSESIDKAIQHCSQNKKASLQLTVEEPGSKYLNRKVRVSAHCPAELAGKLVELFIAVTEDNLTSNVHSGENAGAVLEHTGVVRSFKQVGGKIVLDQTKGISYATQVILNPQWKRKDLRLVAFLQEPSTLRIWGAGQAKLE